MYPVNKTIGIHQRNMPAYFLYSAKESWKIYSLKLRTDENDPLIC
jgi:hypothetical protein